MGQEHQGRGVDTQACYCASMKAAREHLIKRTTAEIIELLLGRHTPEERARILADIIVKLKEKR